jgi:NAD+ diphosphatase
VRWFTRAEAQAVLNGDNPEVRAPSPLAIARMLLEAWVAEEDAPPLGELSGRRPLTEGD